MFEASFSDVVEVVLVILLIYFGLKFLLRWFGPVILRYFLRKIGKQVEKKFEQFDQNRDNPAEGKLNKKVRNRKSNKDVGEYIDYEEID